MVRSWPQPSLVRPPKLRHKLPAHHSWPPNHQRRHAVDQTVVPEHLLRPRLRQKRRLSHLHRRSRCQLRLLRADLPAAEDPLQTRSLEALRRRFPVRVCRKNPPVASCGDDTGEAENQLEHEVCPANKLAGHTSSSRTAPDKGRPGHSGVFRFRTDRSIGLPYGNERMIAWPSLTTQLHRISRLDAPRPMFARCRLRPCFSSCGAFSPASTT